ncbi:MAG: response regulator [Deltaproteobacteria bacterium]|nr:response regulator [Candidatus Zymogenaceae bacterium]
MADQRGIVLVVDDEAIVRDIISDVLVEVGYVVHTAENGMDALEKIKDEPPDLIITDMKMPKMGGMELLNEINHLKNKFTTVMMTGFATVESAVEAIKQGAYDYIMKPFQFADLLRVVEHAMEKQQLLKENLELKETMTLYDISQAISSNLNQEVILSMLVEALMKEGDADAVVLCLSDITQEIITPDIIMTTDERLKEMLSEKVKWGGVLEMLDGKEGMIFQRNDVAQVADVINGIDGIESLMFLPMVIKDKPVGVTALLSMTRGYRFTEGSRKALSILVNNVTVAVENARLYEDIVDILEDTVNSFARTLDAKDKYASGHSERVTRYALMIAHQMRLSREDTDTLAQAGLLHDIGKIGISEFLLNKKGVLDWDEYEETKLHPVIGRDILAPVEQFQHLAEIIYHHHERYDGGGYPEGISGDDIPLLSRIIAVADAFDAMTSTRSYREKLNREKAVLEIQANSGTQFDPKIVDAFLAVVDQLDFDENPSI